METDNIHMCGLKKQAPLYTADQSVILFAHHGNKMFNSFNSLLKSFNLLVCLNSADNH